MDSFEVHSPWFRYPKMFFMSVFYLPFIPPFRSLVRSINIYSSPSASESISSSTASKVSTLAFPYFFGCCYALRFLFNWLALLEVRFFSGTMRFFNSLRMGNNLRAVFSM